MQTHVSTRQKNFKNKDTGNKKLMMGLRNSKKKL